MDVVPDRMADCCTRQERKTISAKTNEIAKAPQRSQLQGSTITDKISTRGRQVRCIAYKLCCQFLVGRRVENRHQPPHQHLENSRLNFFCLARQPCDKAPTTDSRSVQLGRISPTLYSAAAHTLFSVPSLHVYKQRRPSQQQPPPPVTMLLCTIQTPLPLPSFPRARPDDLSSANPASSLPPLRQHPHRVPHQPGHQPPRVPHMPV